MSAQERGTFDNLARNADELQFSVSVAQWVNQTYPQVITGLERLGQRPELREVASSAAPELRAQLSDAQKILRTAAAAPNGHPITTGTVEADSSKPKSD